MNQSVSDAIRRRYQQTGPVKISFLLLVNYTMISLATAVEPLRMANQLSGRELYRWKLITEDGEPVAASDGILTIADASIQNAEKMDILIVVGGWDIVSSYTQRQIKWLKELDREGVRLGGVCTGAYVLAEAHLLDGYECSVHWECMAALQENNPLVLCNNRLFSVADKRLTCTGGTAPLDMMLNIICAGHGLSLANTISEMFILDRIRDETDNQKVPLKFTPGVTPPKLVDAARLMEANIEEPLPLDKIASLLKISRRSLERLFKDNLKYSPSRYYLRVRLYRARQLLKQTTLSVVEIASLCGFVSTPHFSKCYRTHIGIPPREERTRMLEQNAVQFAVGQEATANRLARREPSFGSVEIPGG